MGRAIDGVKRREWEERLRRYGNTGEVTRKTSGFAARTGVE